MSAITPQTDVYLLKVPLEIDNDNQLTFASATAQHTYFNGLPKIALDNFTYQRKDGTIRVPYNIDDIITYNYVMYRNEGFSNKWFYAYITGMDFLNPSTTLVSIKTDTFQTWQFDLTYKPTFVEREHVNDDTIGANTVPESLELGDYVINDMRKIPMYTTGTASSDFVICFAVSKLPYNDAPWFANPYSNIGGVFSSEYMFAVETFAAARNVIKVYEDRNNGTSDAIQNVYMIPRSCMDNTEYKVWSSTHVGGGVYVYQINQLGWTSDKFTLEEPKVLAGSFTPKNAKLFTYPYSYFYIDNNAGMSVDYRWEDFPNASTTYWQTQHPKVEYYKALIPSPSISGKLFFDNYKGYQTSQGARTFNYGISFGKIPVCAWVTDYYTNWLTQNGVNVGANVAAGVGKGLLGAGISLATGNPVGLIGSAISIGSTIANTIGENQKAATTPPQAHGDTNCGDFSFAYDRCAMNFYMMSIKPEYARIIDNYFSAYGYKVNSVKTPNITGRRNWNYVKTVGCYIEADIPQDDLQEIKTLFDKGITLWHNPATFADYTQANDII